MTNEKDCELCGLWDRCKTPYLDVVGNGGKRIMFVYGNPSNKEDKSGNMMVDDPDLFLMETLKDMGIDFNEDCWRTNAVQCFAGNDVPTNAINLCRKNMLTLIEKLQPRVIIPLGNVALQALIGDRTSKRISLSPFDKWIKWVIPDQQLQTYIAPLYPPDDVLATLRKKQKQLKKYDKYRKFSGKMWHDDQLTKWSADYKILNRVFRTTLKNAVSDKLNTFYTNNYESECGYVERDDALMFLKDLLNNKRTIAFDYETTGIKPHREGHEILCIGISDGIVSYAFKIHNDPVFLNTLKRVLRDPDIKKIGHNAKFEEVWTRVILGYGVRGWTWDCMIAAHVKDNRTGITGLKFQSYAQFGILGYDDTVDKYIECSAEEKTQYGDNGFNRLKTMPDDELCKYCAIDAHLTYHLYGAQQSYRRQKGFDKAYGLFHDGMLAFADIEQNGIMVDMERVLQYDLDIEQKLISIKQEIDTCEEVQKWDGENPFNFASPKDMKHLLYGILGYSPVKMTKKGVETYGNDSDVKFGFESTDIESLGYINSPLTNKILEYKKLYKIRNTYIAGIKREAVNGIVHPSFNLNTVSSFRSSSSSPNFQNFSKHDPIANHYVKGLFRPRKGNQLIEFDYGQLEVRGAASVSHDDSLIKYTSDPTTDMHRDAAVILFMKDPDTIDKNTERFHVKNKWVFAQFYGDYYKPCAEKLWAVMDVKTKRWLRRFNIHVKADFVEHCKDVEKRFWGEMFPGYDAWRNTNWQSYVDTGLLYWPTGFVSNNIFRRNQVNNLPVQGGSFHLTLGSVILVNKALKEHKLKSLCIGQIHDSIVFDAVPEEVESLTLIVGQIMKHEVLKANPWIIVPLVVEADIYPIDGDWSEVETSKEVT